MQDGADGDPERSREWVQIDQYGVRSGRPFIGDAAALTAHLLAELPDGAVSGPVETDIYLREHVATVRCTVVTLRTPWCSERWVLNPAPYVPRRHAWLLRR